MTRPVVLLRELASGELDAASREALQKHALKIGAQFTVYEGVITRKVRIAFHGSSRGHEKLVQALVAEELAAIPAESLGACQ
jgi:hypothetical protein